MCAYTPTIIWADAENVNSLAAPTPTARGITTADAVTASAASSASIPPVIVYHIPCNCSVTYEPVCGSDGVSYSNECVMHCVSMDHVSQGRPLVHRQHLGICRIFSCNCLPTVDPVCGTSNHPYTNDCYRVCVNSYRTDIGLPSDALAYSDICKPTVCFCPDAIIPICGTDIKTYRNICNLQCYSRVNQARGQPAIFMRHRGACKYEKCNCPVIEKHICASDGNTYYNKCSFDCKNGRRDQLGIKPLVFQYLGDCIKCSCTATIDPVCGSDGNTYSNYCLLLCKNKKLRAQSLQELNMRWQGPCKCECIKKYQPVCSSDRHTWSNRCLLDCENKNRTLNGFSQLSVLYDGECRQCKCAHCPDRYSPVCGSDYLTYQTSCILKCTSKCSVEVGMLPISEISKGECYR